MAGRRPARRSCGGLIDEVDDQLGDLLARRVRADRARCQAAQAPTPARDPEREREIAAARWPPRAPALGEDRLARIVHAIITESLDAVLRLTA